MKDTRFFGPYIMKAVKDLKKSKSRFDLRELVWDNLDRDYEIYVTVRLKKKRRTTADPACSQEKK